MVHVFCILPLDTLLLHYNRFMTGVFILANSEATDEIPHFLAKSEDQDGLLHYLANSEEPYEMPPNAAFHLGLHYCKIIQIIMY